MSYDDYLLTRSQKFQVRATTFRSNQGNEKWFPVEADPDGKCFWRALSQGVVYGNLGFDDVYRLSLDPFQYQVKKNNGTYDTYLRSLPDEPDGLFDTFFRRARRIFRLNLYNQKFYESQTGSDGELLRIFDLHYELKANPQNKYFGTMEKAYGIFRQGSILFDKDDKTLTHEVKRIQPAETIARFWAELKDEYGLEDDTLRTRLAHWRVINGPDDGAAVYDANIDVRPTILQVMAQENVSRRQPEDDFSIDWAGQSELIIASHLPCVQSIQCWNMQGGGWEQWDDERGITLSNPNYNGGANVRLLYNGTHYDTLIHRSRIDEYLSNVAWKSNKKSKKKKSTYHQYGRR